MELEWLVHTDGAAADRCAGEDLTGFAAELERGAGPRLPAGGTVSLEPGGQLELSTRPADSLGDCVRDAAEDLAVLRELAAGRGLVLRGAGLDDRPPRLRVALPRYLALDHYYRRAGDFGRTLLCGTASVQVNVDAGDGSRGWRGRARRWALANALGPVLMAMFANSPATVRGAFVRSGRQVLRLRTDPARSGPLPPAGDPRVLWAEYALDSAVVGIRSPEGDAWTVPSRALTLRHWLRAGEPRPIHPSDVLHHLKSLVAPVRACGHLELRMIDAQSDDHWAVPPAVVAALLDEEEASDTAWRLLGPSATSSCRADWLRAAGAGLSDPALALVARAVMGIALTGLARLDVPSWVCEAVERYADTYTMRGLSPADSRPAGVVPAA
ncbi:glutamate-cysteine ligase family protein [Streptomyces sp. TRM 70361]|uniref:glutamate-cysteine ligase family protein n=1 Tax=Streptomyces sp. TRM 70361 TaxID=3116553 RepID=UPI002E7C44C1|nr:glutamate-cysteine ligase family protein [Streptomyces sp. TRM 70361]MEE1938977.1 glutamate-cysteine ligase family protein [Streptomyces sp. TRM 70361]